MTGKENGSYDYQVQACNASGLCGKWSDAITVKVFTSGAPANLSSDEASSTDGTYTLSWDEVDGADRYELQENEMEISSDAALSHSVTGKTTDSYEYRVRACHMNGVCSDDWSDTITVNVFTERAPANLVLNVPSMSGDTMSGEGTYSSIDGVYMLSWDEVDGADRYELQENKMPLSLDESGDLLTTHNVMTRRMNGNYSYRIRACHPNNTCTPWSNPITVNVFEASTPTLTLALMSGDTMSEIGTYHSTDGAYTLSWTPVTDADRYELREVSVGTDMYSSIESANVSAKRTGSYNYQLRACHASDACTPWSSAITVNVFTESAPTLTLTETPDDTRSEAGIYSSTDGAYMLSWTTLDGASYQLQEASAGTDTFSAIDSGDVSGKETGRYSYRIRACHTNRTCTPWSDTITVNVFDGIAPALTPMLVDPGPVTGTYSSTDGTYTLSWNPVTNAANYELWEGNSPILSGGARTHSLSGKETGRYSYRVRACHTNTACTPWSSPVTVNVYTESAPSLSFDTTDPTDVTDDGAYTLNWSAVDDADSYQLEEKLSTASTWSRISPTTGTRAHDVTGQTTGSYEYRVRACHTNTACTPWSTTQTAHVFAENAPSLSFDATNPRDDGAYTLNWSAVTDANSYQLEEKLSTASTWSRISPTTETRAHDVTGKTTNSYDYRVRACHTNTACTPWSTTQTAHVFAASAPSLSLNDPTAGDGNYTLNWALVTGAVNYRLEEKLSTTPTWSRIGTYSTSPFPTSHDLTGKTTNAYEYRIRACHTNTACTPWSDTLTVSEFAESAPTLTSPESTSGDRDGVYDLNWTTVNAASTYELEEGGNVIFRGDALTYTVTDQVNGTHRYQVRACHANGSCTALSTAVSIKVVVNCVGGDGATLDATTGFNFGSGTQADPYLICDYTQLAKMGVNTLVTAPLTKHYKLGAHIDASDSLSANPKRDGTMGICTKYSRMPGSTTAGQAGHISTCTGWKPVGNSTTAFTGSLEGAGYEIRDLYINVSTTTATTHVGLFGRTGSGSLIQNVGMTDVYIRVDTASSHVGGLVGSHEGGSIRNTYVDGSFTTSGASANTGGLVGSSSASINNSYATGTINGSGSSSGGLVGNNTGSISNSYTTASVTGTGSSSGGLVGANATGGKIRNSYAAGTTVTGGSSSNTGGLVGTNSGGSIRNSYATATVTTGSNVGGLVGSSSGSISKSYATGGVTGSATADTGGLVGENASGGSVSYSYAAGAVMTGTNVGGLVGNNAGSINDTNYFIDDDGGTNGIGTGTCAGTCTKPTGAVAARQLHLQNTLNEMTTLNWNPTHWKNFSGTGVAYPLLKYAQIGTCSASPLTLTTRDLCEEAGTCDVGAGAHTNRMACETASPTPGMWTPTNTWTAGEDECDGTTGVTCGSTIADCSDDSSIGIGTTASPYLICNYDQLNQMRNGLDKHYELVTHIDASDSYKTGGKRSGSGDCTTFNGTNGTSSGQNGHDDTCKGWIPVGSDTTHFTGSLQGANYEIRNLYISIKTTSTTYTPAGLFARTGGASLIQGVGLTNVHIRVDKNQSRLGSLAGRNDGNINNCHVTGSLFNNGDNSYVGGLLGENYGSLTNSYATASVTTDSNTNNVSFRVGGLVGDNRRRISNSYATGNITVRDRGGFAYPGGSRVGGLVGNNEGDISNTYATGMINVTRSVESDTGGLVGYNDGDVSNSYATGSVTNNGGTFSIVAGLMGTNYESLSNSYAAGSNVRGNATRYGLVGWTTGGRFSGKNYYLHNLGTNGVNSRCSNTVCIRAGAGVAGVTTNAQRRTWLEDTLNEKDDMGWSDTNWSNIEGGPGFPKLKYAQVSGICTNSSHNSSKTNCENNSAYWLVGECGGSTGVTCGDTIPGQD